MPWSADHRTREESGEIIAVNAAKELTEALALIGVKFPSLRGDGVAGSGTAMVWLGGASAQEAFILSNWIRKRLAE
ncbi:hypothetical protein [Streptomyces sp. 8N706]|uniref:hypothetical protein n=1 Tax=Streptomyces sp. 8N706 TaxID=3457416 RepID=UPI003FD6439F